jgi:hypothetical protein
VVGLIVIANECVDCGLPCIYEACPYYEVVRYYCDECGEESELYYWDGEQLCVDCILKQLERVEYND